MNQSQKMSLDNEERKNKVINENSEKKKEQSDHKEDIDADADANKKIYKESVSTNKSTQTDNEATSFRSILQSKVKCLQLVLRLFNDTRYLSNYVHTSPIVHLTNFKHVKPITGYSWQDNVYHLLFLAGINICWIADCDYDYTADIVYITAVNRIMQRKIKVSLVSYFKNNPVSAFAEPRRVDNKANKP